LFVADRLKLVDSIVTLRVRAEPGDYFNCYYKGKQASYHHIRMRGDSGAYLDGYVPRDAAGEKLWLAVNRGKSTRVTLKFVMRAATVSDVCVGQVEVLEHELGWDYAKGGLGEIGVLPRRLKNSKDKSPTKNKISLATFLQTRKRYVDKTIQFRARGRLDRYYQCRYRDAERTHYAMSLSGDGFKSLRAYAPRNDRGRALAYHLASNVGGPITVEVTVPAGRFDEVCADQVEVVDWYKGWGLPPG
jgi:hypothetical protein